MTPTCPHCPRAVTLAHRLAVESPLITASCVEATEFMDLSRRFRVTGVPKTIVNESIEILGALPRINSCERSSAPRAIGWRRAVTREPIRGYFAAPSIRAVLMKSSFGYSAVR